jgi:hypothetical protein
MAEVITCAMCGEQLDHYAVEDFFGETIQEYWHHSVAKDHIAVPVLTKQEHD